jgi:IS5 family transposase
MRLKAEAIFQFVSEDDQQQNKIVREYRREYKRIGEILNRQPKILEMAHRDLAALSKATFALRGRKADFTSENLFRAILVMQIEGFDYRQTSVWIAESETIQNFCRLLKKRTLDYTLLNKAFCAIRPETWEVINNLLAFAAVKDKAVSVDHIRADTTVTECNIHWPTDSSLLWNTYRVVAREISRAREISPLADWSWRFHPKKIKKMDFFIARYGGSNCKKRQRQVHRRMKEMIERVEKVLENAGTFVDSAKRSANTDLQGIGLVLEGYLPHMRRAVAVARRREFDGEKVPNSEKVFSIFEPHAELIRRGRRDRPIEFGHKLLLTQSKEKFITDYVVLEQNRGDNELLPVVLDRHEEKHGRLPETVAADKGVCPDADTYEDLLEQVDFLGVPRRTRDFGGVMMGIWDRAMNNCRSYARQSVGPTLHPPRSGDRSYTIRCDSY